MRAGRLPTSRQSTLSRRFDQCRHGNVRLPYGKCVGMEKMPLKKKILGLKLR